MDERMKEIAEIAKVFQLDVEKYENCVLLKSRETGSAIEVSRDEYYIDEKKDKKFSEFTVRFATQHRHFDEWKDAEAYIRMLLTEERLPIEFYGPGQFGSDIARDDFFNLSIST